MLSTKLKKDIRKIESKDLELFLQKHEESTFRSKQIQEWLWKKGNIDFDSMTNLSKKIRSLLKDNFNFYPVKIVKEQKSKDGTLKFLFELFDGHHVEGVLIPMSNRFTACISSQVGCALTCKFCATGFLPRIRNLEASEIYDQVRLINQKALEIYKHKLTNIVYMGMGEPLLNYSEVIKSLDYLTEKGLGFSKERITISTAGIAKMIRKLGDDKIKCKLALSLHAVDDKKRNSIMPINQSNNLTTLRDALKYYYSKVKKLVTFEYIIFKDFNDTLKDAEALYSFSKHVPSKINIIEYNNIEKNNFINTSPKQLEHFVSYLESCDLNVNIRKSRGEDIAAACGQLANKSKK